MIRFSRLLSFTLLLALVVGSAVSCKKGENDPIFSLRTRKARLTGDWLVKTATWSVGDTTWTLADNRLSVDRDGTADEELDYTMNFGFEKDGTYYQETVTTYPNNYLGNGLPEYIETIREEGLWNWAGGNEESRAKSKLLLIETKVTISSTLTSNIIVQTFEGQTGGFLYDIDELANDNMTLLYTLTTSTATTQITETGDFRLEKQ